MPVAIDLRDLNPLDQTSRLPLYAQLADMLADRIRRSQSKFAGLLLPTEKEMADHFEVSRPTVRQAMEQLRVAGLIYRRSGQGTFVSPLRASRDMGQIVQFELLPPDRDVEFKLVQRERVAASPDVAKIFEMQVGEQLERITRLRFIDGKIFAFEERFVPVHIGIKITDHALESEAGAIFVRRLIDGRNGNVAFRFGAIPAPPPLAKMLRTKVGAPLLSSRHTYFASKDKPVLHGTIYFRGDRYDFGFRAPIHGI
jgi:GntR family transcriptional regulator